MDYVATFSLSSSKSMSSYNKLFLSSILVVFISFFASIYLLRLITCLIREIAFVFVCCGIIGRIAGLVGFGESRPTIMPTLLDYSRLPSIN